MFTMVLCQRGLFFATDKPATTINFQSIPTQDGARENELITLQNPLHFFQQKNISDIRVFRDGFVTIGPNLVRPGCPKKIKDGGPGISAISPFWMQTTVGTVTHQQFTSIEQLSQTDRTNMAEDINKGFRDNVELKTIISIVLITWSDMRNEKNAQRAELKNSFQLAIVSTASVSYAIFVYKVVDVYWVNQLNGRDADCRENAITGLRAFQRKDDFSLSSFFPTFRGWISYFSNIDDFQNLGRYTVKLVENTRQPLPPVAECTKNKPDPTICIRSSWFSMETIISDTFCQFRDAGLYQYPLACNQIVQCGVGSSSFKLSVCPKGTNFNPQIGVCDWEKYFECRFPPNVTVFTNETVKHQNFTNMSPKTVTPTRQKVHNNFCFLRRDGWFADPNRCEYILCCVNSRGITSKCPAGLFWQITGPGKGYCNFRNAVKCKDGVRPTTITTTTTPTTTTTTTPSTTAPRTTIKKTYPTNPWYPTTKRTYPTARTRYTTRKTWQPMTIVWYPPTTSPMKPHTHHYSKNQYKHTTEREHFCHRYGQFPDPTSCTKYMVCAPGWSQPIRMSCPAGLYFKTTTRGSGYCEFSYQVCCSNGNRQCS